MAVQGAGGARAARAARRTLGLRTHHLLLEPALRAHLGVAARAEVLHGTVGDVAALLHHKLAEARLGADRHQPAILGARPAREGDKRLDVAACRASS